jgi:hypothetical protein
LLANRLPALLLAVPAAPPRELLCPPLDRAVVNDWPVDAVPA